MLKQPAHIPCHKKKKEEDTSRYEKNGRDYWHGNKYILIYFTNYKDGSHIKFASYISHDIIHMLLEFSANVFLFSLHFYGFHFNGVRTCAYGLCYCCCCCCCFCCIHDEIVSHAAVCVHWNLISYRNVLMNRCCLANIHAYSFTHSFSYTSISVRIFNVVVWYGMVWYNIVYMLWGV